MMSDDANFQDYTIEVYPTNVQNENIYGSAVANNGIITDFKWSHEIIKLLLDLRLSREIDFNQPLSKKRNLWNTIAEEIYQISQCKVTGDMCDVKYRNLLATYKSNRKKKDQNNECSITWEYFTQFDSVLGEKVYSAKDMTGANFENYSREVYASIKIEKEIIACGSEIATASTATDFKWTPETTKLLLDLRLSREKEFNQPQCKKKNLWNAIAEEMCQSGYCNLTSDMCDVKYRNLLATYKSNKRKKEQSGESAITWEYFTQFDIVLGDKVFFAPSKDMIGANLLINNSNVSNAASSSNISFLEEGSSGGGGTKGCAKKRKTEISFNEYLYLKLKREEAKQKEKEKKEEERWKEKKYLKEREIRAIEALAEAIARKYK
ncbi:hypothetical protein NQ314_006095 [Rhamnusium bicolor]|uniref:Myb/SANT-like DNA-binding domain-containing protein n=1 Tax=Rhamnusium bicolor TaxID=1586634 RepID=A0AAV8Z8C2_9CUCU|nr:hypothetical protein NQ314_006095 [Rhamnusium bicolor]